MLWERPTWWPREAEATEPSQDTRIKELNQRSGLQGVSKEQMGGSQAEELEGAKMS